jgi:hypothetical protein
MGLGEVAEVKRLLFAIPLLTFSLSASPLVIGPISLTGSGTLSDPDYSGYGGEGFAGLGLVLHASGSNGADQVSIDTMDIELTGQDFFQDIYLQNMTFDAGPFGPNACVVGVSAYNVCYATIDGITGFGAFSIGGGGGLIQVFADLHPGQFNDYPGPLLAEAQIINTQIDVTGVTYSPGGFFCPTCPPFPDCQYCPPGQGRFTAAFAITDPPANVPEPGTGWPILWAALIIAAWLIGRRIGFWLKKREGRR